MLYKTLSLQPKSYAALSEMLNHLCVVENNSLEYSSNFCIFFTFAFFYFVHNTSSDWAIFLWAVYSTVYRFLLWMGLLHEQCGEGTLGVSRVLVHLSWKNQVSWTKWKSSRCSHWAVAGENRLNGRWGPRRVNSMLQCSALSMGGLEKGS